MPFCDMHTHTVYSPDARTLPGRLIRDAAEAGLYGVAVTDHFDIFADRPGASYYDAFAQRRRASFERARALCAGSLGVWYGIELGQPHHNIKAYERIMASEDFDVVIGSMHSMEGYRHFLRTDYGSRQGCEIFFRQYFAEMLEMVNTCDFDVLGHLDYPVRVMGKYMADDPGLESLRELIVPVLKACVRRGVALEINTAGMRRWLDKPGPAKWALEEYRRFGGEMITFGSDAHVPGHCGYAFSAAAELAASAGFDRTVYFVKRSPRFLMMDQLKEGEHAKA